MNSENRVRPKEAREAREVIRKHDPALAMYLDVVMPVEKCKHDWKKAQSTRRNTLWDNRWNCSGCGEYVVRVGTHSNYWITEAEWKARCRKLGQFFQGDRRIRPGSIKATVNPEVTVLEMETEVYDGAGNWVASY